VTGESIARSLELAAERGGDITPLVYRNLFARFPEMEALFIRDTTGAVRGEMLARTIETIFNYLEGDTYATNLLRSEIMNHEGYGVPPDTFATFYEVLAATVADLAGPDWSPEMAAAWREVVTVLAGSR